MRITALRSLVISAAALFVLAGCGSVEVSGNVNTGDEFENAKLERVISEGLEKSSDDDTYTWKTKCPKDIKMKKGDEFDCTSTNQTGYQVRIAVTQTDAKGNIDYELVDDVEPNGSEREDAPAAEDEDAAAPEA